MEGHSEYEVWYKQNTCWRNLKKTIEGTYVRDIYSGIDGKWYRRSWEEFDELKNIHQNHYCSNY